MTWKGETMILSSADFMKGEICWNFYELNDIASSHIRQPLFQEVTTPEFPPKYLIFKEKAQTQKELLQIGLSYTLLDQ